MSAYTALEATSRTLSELIKQRLAADASLNSPPLTVSLKTPREMGAERGISLWLYRVVRNEFWLNQPPERLTAGLQRRTPLPVGLHYLVTPMLDQPETEQLVMGKVLQVYLGLDYARLTTVLLEAVKELAAQNEALEQRLEALETPAHPRLCDDGVRHDR